MKIGIIAEDKSDVAVMKALTLKLLRPQVPGFKRFVGDGCGKLRRKCGAWAKNLVQQGCCCVLVVHDLDQYNESNLRAQLSSAVGSANARAWVVLIPRREIEAWLLYDPGAIAKAFSEKVAPKLKGNPESLTDPKKHLSELVWRTYHKQYLNTIHNERVASAIAIARLRSSSSFAPHFAFCSTIKKLPAGS
jgi:hypothetical protein